MSQKPKTLSDAIEQLETHTGINLESEMKRLNEQMESFKSRLNDEAKKAKSEVEHKVQENPWAALGVVGLVFFLIGFLLGRRSD